MGRRKGFNGTFLPTNIILPTLVLCKIFRSYSNFLFIIIIIIIKIKTIVYFYMEDIKPIRAVFFSLQETKKSKKKGIMVENHLLSRQFVLTL